MIRLRVRSWELRHTESGPGTDVMPALRITFLHRIAQRLSA